MARRKPVEGLLHSGLHRGRHQPRRDYTMTPEQFVAMGGVEPPIGYDPENATTYVRHHEHGGVGYQHTVVEGRTPVKPTSLDAFQELAAYHRVHMLTIHWPDHHSPDFTARPLDGEPA